MRIIYIIYDVRIEKMNYNKITGEALGAYSITSKLIEPIARSGGSDGAVYKVADSNDIYCLKIYVSDNDKIAEKSMVNSEFEWVAALARDTDITVPTAYKNTDGEYVTVVDGVSCVLMKWLEGRPSGFEYENGFIKAFLMDGDMDEFDDKIDAINFIKVLGKLHKHASEWQSPAGFKRPSVEDGTAEWMGNICANLDALDGGLYDEEAIEAIKSGGRKAVEKVKTIEKNNMTWGLIHDDFQIGNYIVNNHEICPVDFTKSKFNYYLSDVALGLHFVAPEKREFFCDIYSRYFPLPENYVNKIETLLVVRQLQMINFYLNEYQATKEDKDRWLPKDIKIWGNGEFKHYLNNEPFLLDKKAFYQQQFS